MCFQTDSIPFRNPLPVAFDFPRKLGLRVLHNFRCPTPLFAEINTVTQER